MPTTHTAIPGAAKWTAVRNKNGTASLQDFVVSVDAATPAFAKSGAPPPPAPAAAGKEPPPAPVAPPTASLLAYTMGRLSGCLPPVELSSLDLRQLALLLCIDMSQNDTSSRRQMSADVLKTPRQIASEQPLMVSALASLSGVGAMLVHAWSTPTNAQTRFLRLFLRKFATTTPAAAGAGAGAAGGAAAAASTRTLLAAVAHASTTPTPPFSTATKAIAAPGKRGIRRSILRTESEESGISDFGPGESVDGSVDAPESVASSTPTHAASAAAAAAVAGPAVYPVKKWVRLARVVYGVPYLAYSEN